MDLQQIFWIGGSPCSGKSSISRILAERCGFGLYSVDDSLPRFQPHLDPQRQPTLIRWTTTAWDELWMQPESDLLAQAIAAYTEHFGLVVADLQTLGVQGPVLVEGTALLPELVQPYLAEPNRGVWIVPSEPFQRRMYPQRGGWVKGILASCRQPEAAFRNWMERDAAFGRWVLSEVERLNLVGLVVDGSRTIEQNVLQVAKLLNLSW